MSEEIKKILDRLERLDHKSYCCGFEFADSGTFEETCDCFEERKKLANCITNLQQKYDKALETLVDYNLPCEIDDFMNANTDYCELACGVDEEQYKKCWNKFIEWKLKDE